MPTTYSGGCACGALRYETSAQPIFQNHCQCTDCQSRSGTGHGSFLTFANRAQVAITGTPRTWAVAGDSGHLKSHGFCPNCGSPVFLTFAAQPNLLTIHAGSLDAPELFQPQVVSYAKRGPDWDMQDPALPAFQTMPG